MNANQDEDLQTLDALLDGELDDRSAEAVRQRLSTDSALAEAMEQLQADRDARIESIRRMEPTDASVDQAVERVMRQGRRIERSERILRFARPAAAIAASVLVGLMIGRSSPTPTPGVMPVSSGSFASAQQLPDRGIARSVEPVGRPDFNPTPASLTPVSAAGAESSVRPPSTPLVFSPRPTDIALTDESGQVVATQRFANPDEAARFVSELRDLQRHRMTRPAAVSPIIPASAEQQF